VQRLDYKDVLYILEVIIRVLAAAAAAAAAAEETRRDSVWREIDTVFENRILTGAVNNC